jgi:hypothetical protein
MAAIGIELPADSLVLTRGRDFKWSFENLDEDGTPVDFADGTLYFEFPKILDAGVPRKWMFAIVGAVATIKVESTAADQIPERALWQLVFLPDGETAGGDPVALGKVSVQGAR